MSEFDQSKNGLLYFNNEGIINEDVERYSVDKAIEYYYPDDFARNVDDVRKRLERLESDYYQSGFKTIREWAEDREEYDKYKDSTGHD